MFKKSWEQGWKDNYTKRIEIDEKRTNWDMTFLGLCLVALIIVAYLYASV